MRRQAAAPRAAAAHAILVSFPGAPPSRWRDLPPLLPPHLAPKACRPRALAATIMMPAAGAPPGPRPEPQWPARQPRRRRAACCRRQPRRQRHCLAPSLKEAGRRDISRRRRLSAAACSRFSHPVVLLLWSPSLFLPAQRATAAAARGSAAAPPGRCRVAPGRGGCDGVASPAFLHWTVSVRRALLQEGAFFKQGRQFYCGRSGGCGASASSASVASTWRRLRHWDRPRAKGSKAGERAARHKGRGGRAPRPRSRPPPPLLERNPPRRATTRPQRRPGQRCRTGRTGHRGARRTCPAAAAEVQKGSSVAIQGAAEEKGGSRAAAGRAEE